MVVIRAVGPHSIFADPDPGVILNADPDPAPQNVTKSNMKNSL